MNKNRQKITALIPAFNVEDKIADCIKSVAWADEILVVDGSKTGFSTDQTAKIALSMGARVLQHKYEYSAKQKNWTIPKASNDWILLVDSDEVVTEELKKEILELLASNKINYYNGFGIARRHLFLGKWLKWGGRYPLYNIRLFRKDCRYEDRDVHAHIILPKNRVKNLRNDIIHDSDPTLEHFFEKFNRYTTYQANYLLKFVDNKKKIEWRKFFTHYVYTKAVVKDYWYFMSGTSFLRFVYMYILRFGFLDGRLGFLIAVLYGFEDYVSKTKYMELRGRKPRHRFAIQSAIKNLIPDSKKPGGIVDRLSKEELKIFS